MWLLIKTFVSAGIVVTVSEVSPRFPRAGAVLLSLPLMSVLAFIWLWFDQRDLPAVARLARDTIVLVPLGLPFFIPMAFHERLQLGFWSALVLGIALASVTVGVWLYFAGARS